MSEDDLNPDDLLQIWRTRPAQGEILLLVVRESISDSDLQGLSEVFLEVAEETQSTMLVLKETVFENLEALNLVDLLQVRDYLDSAITDHVSHMEVGDA